MPARIRYDAGRGRRRPRLPLAITDIAANGRRQVGEADEGNSGYLTRIAKAAACDRENMRRPVPPPVSLHRLFRPGRRAQEQAGAAAGDRPARGVRSSQGNLREKPSQNSV